MKYRLKFDYYDAGIQHYENDIFEFNNDESRYDSKRHTKIWLPKSFVEKNPNIFEKVEEKPKYEVGDWVKLNDNNYVVQIDLIGNNDEILLKFSGDKVCWIHESQIKCKVKPIKLWFNLYKLADSNYRAFDFSFDEKEVDLGKKEVTDNIEYNSTHSITIYEEIKDEY